jgi:uncharacterized protein YaiI (UPF0178 family)
MLHIYIDADGCPVKEEVFKVAARYSLPVRLVANAPLRLPNDPRLEMVVVKGDFNAADDWIAEHADSDDIVITSDLPLADRCLSKGARVLTSTGRQLTQASIGNALAMRELLADLRQMGNITGGPAPFSKKDRSQFLSKLDEVIQSIRRAHKLT